MPPIDQGEDLFSIEGGFHALNQVDHARLLQLHSRFTQCSCRLLSADQHISQAFIALQGIDYQRLGSEVAHGDWTPIRLPDHVFWSQVTAPPAQEPAHPRKDVKSQDRCIVFNHAVESIF
jgi:hypothetical protein